jgi:hypothetical protein
MSYLKSVTRDTRNTTCFRVAFHGHNGLRACAGTIRTEIYYYPQEETRERSYRECVVYSSRFTRLGALLLRNAYCERQDVCHELRKAFSAELKLDVMPDKLIFSFVGV